MKDSVATELAMWIALFLVVYVTIYLLIKKFGRRVQHSLTLVREWIGTRAGGSAAPQPAIAINTAKSAAPSADKEEPSAPPVRAKNGRVLHPAQVWVPGLLKSMMDDRQPHFILVGESRGGKTTVARAIMSYATNHLGAKLVILDAHVKDGDYPDEVIDKVIGRYRNFAAINEALGALMEEFNWRFSQNHHDHEPLLIFIDEWPTVADSRECPLAGEFLQTIAREAGKIHMHLFIMTTSPLVEDLKVNSATRRNFSRVLVGSYARQLMPDTFYSKEKYPTALEFKGQKMPLGSWDTKQMSQVFLAPDCVWAPRRVRAYPKLQPTSVAQPLPAGEDSDLADEAIGDEAENYIKVAVWFNADPKISAREVARRLFGKDDGRYNKRASDMIKLVRAVSESGTAGGTDGGTEGWNGAN